MSTTTGAPVNATIRIGEDSVDVAVPTGTTIAHLLSLARIPTERGVSVTLADGSAVDPSSALGADIPSGALLAVSGRAVTNRRSVRAAASPAAVAEAPSKMAAPALVFALLVGLVVVVLPIVFGLNLPWWGRSIGPVLALAAVLSVSRRTLLTRPVVALSVPLLVGVPFAAIVPPDWSASRVLALVAGAGACSIAAFVFWAVTRHPVSAAVAGMYGALGALVALGAFTNAGPDQVAPVLLAIGTCLVMLAPNLALPVPESQLVDLPLLTTTAPAVRQPEARPPARITPRRVRFTLDTAAATTHTCSVGGVALAAAASIWVAGLVAPGTLVGRAAAVELVAAVAVLALLARTNQSPVLRIVPRIGATSIAVCAAVVLVMRGVVSVPTMMTWVVAIGFVVFWGAVLVTREPRSAFVGRLGDIVQGFAVTAIVPAAALAAGLFGLIREVAS